jgi:hypothetical protein
MDWSININKKTTPERVIEQTERAVGYLKGPRHSELPDMIPAVVHAIAGINLEFPDTYKKRLVALLSESLTSDQMDSIVENITRRITPSRPQYKIFRDMFAEEQRIREKRGMAQVGLQKGMPPDMWKQMNRDFIGKSRKTKRRRIRKTRRNVRR